MSRRSPVAVAAFCGAVVSSLAFAAPAAAATFTVTNTANSGTGSLRAALEAANASPGLDTIVFNLPANPSAIVLQSALTVTDPVIIDGLSQPGASCDSWPPTLLVELDASQLPTSGIALAFLGGSQGSQMRGVVVHGAAADSASAVQLHSSSNTLQCNFFDIDRTGTDNRPSVIALLILSDNNLIGTNGDGVGDETERNVFGGSTYIGVDVQGHNNRVAGNFFGLNASGTALSATLRRRGLIVRNYGSNNLIGTDGDGSPGDANEGNVFAGMGIGVDLEWVVGNRVSGNRFGTDVTGTVALANDTGIQVWLAAQSGMNLIGTDGDGSPGDALEGNLISGNVTGLRVLGQATLVPQTTYIAGNRIGTTPDGLTALPNQLGISIEANTPHVIIGVDGDGSPGEALEGNLISGNTTGLQVAWPRDLTIAGNLIGTDVTGLVALPNTIGMSLSSTGTNVRIGTDGDGVSDALEANVISGNRSNGLRLQGGQIQTRIYGNHIGLDAAGAAPLPNQGHGVVLDSATGVQLGGEQPWAANHIAYNNGSGISAPSASRNLILGNRIHDNGLAALSLSTTVLRAPTLRLLDANTVQVSVFGPASESGYRFELFASDAFHPSASGEAEVLIGTATSAPGTSEGVFEATIIFTPDPNRPFLSATATNLAVGETSALSPRAPVPVLFVPQELLTTDEEVPLALVQENAPRVEDPSPMLEVTLSSAEGTFEADGDALVTVTGSGSSTLTLRGEAEPINAILDGVVFTPGLDLTGLLDVLVTADNGAPFELGGETASAVFSIEVFNINDAPQAVDDMYTTEEDTRLVMRVLDNDFDPDGDALVVIAVTQAAHGEVRLNADSSVSYTPESDYTGADSFTYTIQDEEGLTATATVSIDVGAFNRAPVFVVPTPLDGEVVRVLRGERAVLVFVATDPDGDTVTLTAPQLPPTAHFEPSLGVLTWRTPVEELQTIWPIVIAASDGRLEATRALTIELVDVLPGDDVSGGDMAGDDVVAQPDGMIGGDVSGSDGGALEEGSFSKGSDGCCTQVRVERSHGRGLPPVAWLFAMGSLLALAWRRRSR